MAFVVKTMLDQTGVSSDSRDPRFLLELLQNDIDSRTCRLFATACCRRIWNHLPDYLRSAVEIAERFAEGKVDDDTRIKTYQCVENGCEYVDGDSSPIDRLKGFASEAVLSSLFGDGDYPPIPTYAVTCAIAAAEAVQEVLLAYSELSGRSNETCEKVATAERLWQYEYLCRTLNRPAQSDAM